MEKRKFRDLDISLLGFGLMRLPRLPGGEPGKMPDVDFDKASMLVEQAIKAGVNYFDTAYVYGGSEAFAGQALSKYPRDSYYLATKIPPGMVKTEADFERIFAEQLARCQTDYFDFYLLHNLTQELKSPEENGGLDIFALLEKKRAEGKIRWIGFSFHGAPKALRKLAVSYEWDFAQVQLNYVDMKATDAKTQYEILAENNIPVVIMEPLRGGALADLGVEANEMLKKARPESSLASWGIRFAASLPSVLTVLSGMNEKEQMYDNIATIAAFEPVTDEEKALLEEVSIVYGKSGVIACTGCRYCAPCPEGVDIARVFSIYNHYLVVKSRIPFTNSYNSLEETEKASSCIQCGQCVDKCPQHLDIPSFMKEIADFANPPA